MKKIMVLEEGNLLSEMIKPSLLSGEYELISTANKSVFNKQFPGLIPDLIIADLTSIKNSNVELLIHLKSDPIISLFPFLLITSNIHSRTEDISNGLNYYLKKPFSEKEFLQLLKIILKESKRMSSW